MPGMYPYSSMPTGLLSFQTGGDVYGPPQPGDTFTNDPTLQPPADPNQPVPVPGMPGYYWVPNPLTGVPQLVHDTSGTGGTGGTANYHLDPRELQLQYDQLYQAAIQHGQTEEDARRQALAGLLENRNSQQVALSNAYGNIAQNAAQFAQKPTDAVADLMYRNAMFGSGQGGTPYGSTNNASMTQMQGALADKFQQMFGPAAGALSTAQKFLLSPPPTDYLSPQQRQSLGQNPGEVLPTPTYSGGTPGGTQNPTPGAAQGGVINGSFFGAPLASGWGFAQGGSASVQPFGLSAASGAPNTQAGLTGMADGGLVNFGPTGFAGGGGIFGGSSILDLTRAANDKSGIFGGLNALDMSRLAAAGMGAGQLGQLTSRPTGVSNTSTPQRSLQPATMRAAPTLRSTGVSSTGTPALNPTPASVSTAPSLATTAFPRGFGMTGPQVSFSGGGSVGAVEGFSNFGTVSSNGGMGYAYGGKVGVRPPPMPAEGGLSLNLSEPAKIVGIHSGHVYATVAEPRPDGTPRPERLEIKPLKSELEKDKQLAEQNKQSTMTPQQTLATGGQAMPAAPNNPQGQMAGGQMTGMNSYAQGGGITFGQTPSDFYGALRTQLSNMGAQTGPGQTLPDPRMLSGDFYTNYSRADPQLQGEIQSGYNAQFPNIDFQNTLQRFSPDAPVQSFFRPQVSFA